MTEWKHYPYAAVDSIGYKVWQLEAPLGTVYCVTKQNESPKPNTGEFYKLEMAVWMVKFLEEI